jgi:hypothetical protein
MAQVERDFPIGHPAAADTVIGSPEHVEWMRQHQFLENKRDFPPGHIKAVDTPGNTNHLPVRAGVDPFNTHLEAFTGHTPEKAAAIAAHNKAVASGALESPVLPPVDALVANAALEAKRKELGVEALSYDEHMKVLAALQQPK